MNLKILNFSSFHIHACVRRVIDEWVLALFYGNPEVARRQESWSLLRRLQVTHLEA